MPREALRTFFLGILCLTVVLAAMGYASNLFAPMVAAIVLGIVCAPMTDQVESFGFPRSIAAMLVLFLFLALLASVFFLVEPAVSNVVQNSSKIWSELTGVIEVVRDATSGMRQVQDSISSALNDGSGAVKPAEGEDVALPSAMDALALAPQILASLLIFVGTLYFFLVARTDIYERVDKMRLRLTKDVLCTAEDRVSKYFSTITLINASFGCLVGLVMAALGMPNAILWGLGAFLLNFILYLGPLAFAGALVVGGLIEFDGAYSFLPAAIFIGMNMLEGQFVTPSLVGHHMKVNPLMVFVSLVFWLWLWGPVGGVVAIPILVWCLYVVEHMTYGTPRVAILTEADPAEKDAA